MSGHASARSSSAALIDALEAELALDFFRAFLRVSEAASGDSPLDVDSALSSPDPVADAGNERLLFHAVRNLERSQTWRLIAALWEHIGDRIEATRTGKPLDWRLYDGLSLKTDYWRDPRSDDKPAGYYGEIASGTPSKRLERLAHTRALAYGHGAEEAAANQRFALATLLRRKAGLAWVTSTWGDRKAQDASGGWTTTHLLEVSGAKWREAARAYFRAALFESRASSDDEKGQTFERYESPAVPETGRWPESPGVEPMAFFFAKRDDIDRMTRCWEEWGQARRSAFADPGHPMASRFVRWHFQHRLERGMCNNLGVLEDALRAAFRAPTVRSVLKRKNKAHVAALAAATKEKMYGALVQTAPPEWPDEEAEAARAASPVAAVFALFRWLAASSYNKATGFGTSFRRTAISLCVGFAGLIPGLYMLSGSLGHCSATSGCTGSTVKYVDALRFSLGQSLTVPPSDLGPTSSFGRWLAVTATLFAAFSLGYTVWVITRNAP